MIDLVRAFQEGSIEEFTRILSELDFCDQEMLRVLPPLFNNKKAIEQRKMIAMIRNRGLEKRNE